MEDIVKFHCPNCGAEVDKDNLYCMECGNRIEPRRSPAPVAPAVAVEKTEYIPVHAETVLFQEEVSLIDNWLNPRGMLQLTSKKLTFRGNGGKKKYDMDIPLADVKEVSIAAQNQASDWQRICVTARDKKVLFYVAAKSEWPNKINVALGRICPVDDPGAGRYIDAESQAHQESVIRQSDSYLIDNWWNPRGVLTLNDTSLSFNSVGRKKLISVEISLQDVELVNLVAKNCLAVFRKDKRYLFQLQAKDAKEWVQQINDAVNAVKNVTFSSGAGKRKDYIDEIKRLKELMDEGIISAAEFEEKKKRLLGL